MEFSKITIAKNRGWRGLARATIIEDKPGGKQLSMTFSFSQPVWNDLINDHKIVIQDHENYYIVTLNDKGCERLPKPTQQRSVLIKNWMGTIDDVQIVPKAIWTSTSGDTWTLIRHLIKNKNNHTQSDWNCVGIRVRPSIPVIDD